MPQRGPSPHSLALEDEEAEGEAGTNRSGERSRARIPSWVVKNRLSMESEDLSRPRSPSTLYNDKRVRKARAMGRDVASTEENINIRGSVHEVAGFAAGLLPHPTISQDQTSGGPFFREKLAALSKPSDQTSIIPGHRKAAGSDTTMPRSKRSSESSSPEMYSITVYEEPRSNDAAEERSSQDTWIHTLEHSYPNVRGTLQESKREEDLDVSANASSSEQSESMEDLLSRLKNLERENFELRNGTAEESPHASVPPTVPHYTWRTFYCIEDDIFLESPQWKEGERGPVLHASSPLKHVHYYLEQHPEIAFVFYKDYHKLPPANESKIISKDGVFRIPEPSRQTLKLISEHMITAVEQCAELIPDFAKFFPDFDPYKEIPAPYMFIYHSMPLFHHAVPHLTPLKHELLEQLADSIMASHGEEFALAKRCAAKGVVSRRLVKYLVRPGDVLVRTQGLAPCAYLATSWAHEEESHEDDVPLPHQRHPHKFSVERNQGSGKRTYKFEVAAWSWAFDGSFEKKRTTLKIQLKVGDEDDEVRITSLKYFPLHFDEGGLHELLVKRGRMFWKCRTKRFVAYSNDDNGVLSSVGERYMIDIDTYKTLHPDSYLSQHPLRIDIDAGTMIKDKPPGSESLLVFPPTITGYNLQTKKWRDLLVDQISDVVWNKQAFESLVAKEKTKELVQALITNQLAAEKSTDLILGKGNGLTILLHGGPGTGKTFTAEGVAELAEKPLFRVTCGDIGTKPDEVEKYLESVFNLGKIWDCVVLLDEADVFLEERGLADLQRNALVSVFLRVLEYNVGILILTSNRVGTFDEAFKSRIQLALHYENLTVAQQKKVWRNFLARLRALDASSIEFDDIMDNIDELVKEDMNGRQIRNAITTARQLALYKGKTFCYEHLKHVIEVSGEFEKYLKTLRQGLSDDQLKREVGFR